jgi:hypothetical protein
MYATGKWRINFLLSMIKYMNTIKRIIASDRFLIAIFILFALQASFFAAFLNFGAPPDEDFHFSSIQYYANESLAQGPFLTNQDPSTIPEVRSIERIVAFLYHYLLSFPTRLMNVLSISEGFQIFILRMINVLIGLASLFFLKKILDKINLNKLHTNLTIVLFSFTGMFVWLSAAINYDNLANLLFLIFCLWVINTIKNPTNTVNPILVIIFGLLLGLTKHTFLPISAIGILVALYYFLKSNVWSLDKIIGKIKNDYGLNKIKYVVLVVILLFTSLVFIERVGTNLIAYNSIQPNCYVFHEVEECNENSLYLGHYERRMLHDDQGGREALEVKLFSHTGEWLNRYYNRLYFYFGHIRFTSSPFNDWATGLLLILFVFTLFLSRKKIRLKPEENF